MYTDGTCHINSAHWPSPVAPMGWPKIACAHSKQRCAWTGYILTWSDHHQINIPTHAHTQIHRHTRMHTHTAGTFGFKSSRCVYNPPSTNNTKLSTCVWMTTFNADIITELLLKRLGLGETKGFLAIFRVFSSWNVLAWPEFLPWFSYCVKLIHWFYLFIYFSNLADTKS